MSYNNTITDYHGKVVGYRCLNCNDIYYSGWGTTCNKCRNEQNNANRLIDEVAKLREELAKLKQK